MTPGRIATTPSASGRWARFVSLVKKPWAWVTATILALGAIGAALGGVQSIEGLLWPKIPKFELSEQRQDELVGLSGMAVSLPVGWELQRQDSGEVRLSAQDEYLVLEAGYLDSVDPSTLPEGRQHESGTTKWREKDVTSYSYGAGTPKESPRLGYLSEFASSGKSDHTTIELVVEHLGSTLFARCVIAKQALDSYREGCLSLIDGVSLFPNPQQLPTYLFFADTRDAGIWHSGPTMFDDSFDYLAANWDDYDPEVPRESGSNPNMRILLSNEVFEKQATLRGIPIGFMGVISTANQLSTASAGSARWVVQLTSSPLGTGYRFYIQVNASPEAEFKTGDMAMVTGAVLVAGGTTFRTDGRIDESLYLLAQNVTPIPNDLLPPK